MIKTGQSKLTEEKGFFESLKISNPFKRILEGLDKIDELKKTGVLEQLKDENFLDLNTEQQPPEILMNREELEERVNRIIDPNAESTTIEQ